MFARSILAFLALPGVIAYAIPLLLAPRPGEATAWRWPGAVLVAAGTVLLLWCVRDFYVAGRGTLAPWSPPQRLVRVGLYRWSRNPMYLSVITLLCGWAAWFGSPSLFVYATAMSVVFHLRVRLYEEPWLNRTFGDDWQQYRRRVPRWLGRGPRRTT